MYTKLIILCGILLQYISQTDAFSTYTHNLHNLRSLHNLHSLTSLNAMDRRTFSGLIGGIASGICFAQSSFAVESAKPDDNRPLTEAEMEEYNKLLEEAKRIQNIIDVNKKAAEQDMLQNKDEFRKNLLQRIFGNLFDK